MINDLRIIEQLPVSTDWLIKNPKGEALPVWVDYQGSENTRWETFTLGSFHKDAFCTIKAN
ncbi:hypothetical protein CAL7716_049140 [Calothrix sp. PCC 7716]|nr:hypothetical protein CAL7716_049140 [Calothrix sp. PCC 7716]